MNSPKLLYILFINIKSLVRIRHVSLLAYMLLFTDLIRSVALLKLEIKVLNAS